MDLNEAALAYQNLYREKSEFVKARLQVLNEYSLESTNDSIEKQKRSVLAWLGNIGNAVYTTFLGGLTQVQIKSLNNHVKETRAEVRIMVERLNRVKTDQILYETKTLGVMKEISKSWLEGLDRLNCKTDLAFTGSESGLSKERTGGHAVESCSGSG